MSQRRRHVSRTLVAVLGAVVVIGLITFIYRGRSADSAEAQSSESVPTVVSELSTESADGQLEPSPSSTNQPILAQATVPDLAQVVSVNAPLPEALATSRPADPAERAAPSTRPLDPPAALAGAVIEQARAKMSAGDLLAARSILNSALLAGQLSITDTAAAKRLLAEINDTVVFSSRRFAEDGLGGTYTVQSGDVLAKIARNHNVTWEFLGRINGISDPRKLKAGQTLKVIQGPFHALVDKSDFALDLYLGKPGEPGSIYIKTYPVGLGADDSTPTGVWVVKPQNKLKNPTYFSPRGEGIIHADDPKNPLGEFWVGLEGVSGSAVGKTSYGLHGTIEPESIGKQASLGCIRMRNEDVAVVWELLVESKSTVTVVE